MRRKNKLSSGGTSQTTLALSDLREERSAVESFEFDIFTEVRSAQNETSLPSLYVRLE